MIPEYKKLLAEYEKRQASLRRQSESADLSEAQRVHIAGQLAALRWVIELPNKLKGEHEQQ
jgi:hypothetical protein